MAANEDTKVITGKVKLSYAHLFEPWSSDPAKNEPKFSTTILIPKSDTTTIGAIRKAQQAAIQNGLSKFGGKVPKTWTDTVHDGDVEKDLEQNPEYAGHYYMSVTAKTQPGLVDKQLRPIVDSTELYSGAVVRVSMNAFAYNTNGNRGVSFGLNHVQKIADGEYFGGRSKAADDFEPVDDEDDDAEDLVGA